MNRRLTLLTFLSVLLLGVLHNVGSYYFLYWRFEWFDILMHFLGGLMVGLLFLWVFSKRFESKAKLFISTFVFIILVSLAWEYFEYYFDIANPTRGNYKLDTIHDLIADILGGLLSSVVIFCKRIYE